MIDRERFTNALKVPVKWALRQSLYRRAVYHPTPRQQPFLIRIDINNFCNLRCKQCHYGDYLKSGVPRHFITVEEYRLLASRLLNHTYHLQFACSFEPLMHPQFVEILEITGRYPIRDVGIATNGTLLDAEKAEAMLESPNLKSVSISVDAVNPATYEAIRGRPLGERLLANIERFQELKASKGREFPVAKANTVIMRSNLHELPDIFRGMAERGLSEVNFFHVEPFDRSNEESVLNLPEDFNAIRQEVLAIARGSKTKLLIPRPLTPESCDPETGRYRRPSFRGDSPRNADLRDPADPSVHPYPTNLDCICPWMVLMIDPWGNIRPCSHRVSREPFANIIRQPLFDAINSVKFLRLRNDMLRGGQKLACPFCSPAEFAYSDPLQCKVSHLRQEYD